MGQENDELLMKIVAGLRLVSKSMQSFAMNLYKKEQEGGGEEIVIHTWLVGSLVIQG